MAFIVSDHWQGLGLGTKMVDYVLDIAKEKGIENVYSIMLPDNQRALSLTKKMGFNLEYLNDNTVKGTLNLKMEDSNVLCQKDLQKGAAEEAVIQTSEQKKDISEKPKAVSA